jgi:hypothetical protein
MLSIEDRLNIQELKYSYFDKVDKKKWNELYDLFIPDAVIDLSEALEEDIAPKQPSNGIFHGGEAFVKFVSAVLIDITTVHRGFNPIITGYEPDAASGRWSMEDMFFVDDGGQLKPVFRGLGHYEETYARVNGVWKYRSLKLTRVYTQRFS